MKNKFGFTLIELVVAISIIGVFFGITFFNQNKGSNVQSVADQDAVVIKNNVLKMYNNTIFGVINKGYGYNNGFGLYFDMSTPKKYVLFCDEDEDLAYDTTEKMEDNILNTAALKSFTPLQGQTMTILFKYKDGKTFINGVLATVSDQIIIKTVNNKTSSEKTVTINPITYKIDVE